MERYEAILEQLKNAQNRGLETIANRLDSVAKSLEELIQEARSSVREAKPQSAAECFPIDEVESALRDFRDEAEAERRRNAELEAEITRLEAAAIDGGQGTTIDLLRSLDGARSQSELLKELLPAISENVARAVVLVLRDGRVSAWSGIGFTNGERLRAWQGDAAESSALATLLEVSRPVSFSPAEDEFFASWLTDEETPEEVLLIPVVLRGKLMGSVYVDRLPGQPWNPRIAQSLVAQVCWLIDTLQYRTSAAPPLAEPVKIGPMPDTTTPVEPPVEETSEAGPDAVTAAVADDHPPMAVEPPERAYEAVEADPSATVKIDVSEVELTEAPADEVIDTEPDAMRDDADFEPVEAEPEPEEGFQEDSFEPEVAAAPDFEPAPEEEVEAPDDAPVAEAIPTEVVISPPAHDAVEETVEEEPEEEPEETPSRFLDEPPPVQPVQPPPEEPEEEVSEEEARQEEARRFARLLVSEIKLYNEEQVERGREARDLYQRLQEDIDRSREMFEKRISEDVRSGRDFFHDELVRILADGDPELLGM